MSTNVPKAPFGFRIDTSQQDGTTTLELEGEWDLAQQAATADAIAHALDERPACLVLDLSQLSFIDSSGVHATITARKRCDEQGTHLVIIPGGPAVQQVFEVCGLIEILPFADGRPPAHAAKIRDNNSGEGNGRVRRLTR